MASQRTGLSSPAACAGAHSRTPIRLCGSANSQRLVGMYMRKSTRILWLMISLSAVTARAQSPSGFPIPASFVDLKQSPSSAKVLTNADQYLAEAENFDVYAVKIEPGGTVAKLGAKVFQGNAPTLDQLRKSFETKIASTGQLAGARILSSRAVSVGGVECGRIEIERNIDGTSWDQLMYELPRGDHWALFTVDAPHDRYTEEARSFEALVPTVRGISAQQSAGSSDASETTAEVGGLLCLIGLGGWLGRGRRRKKRARPTPA